MMGQALRLAFDLMQLPSQVRFVRRTPLPDDVSFLLGVAAGVERNIQEAVQISGRSRAIVIEAAAFFIEQNLLFSDADSYRVLGATPEASNAELRHNMALLLRWLHPDLDPRGERSIFARKVTRAWNDLKTPERRASYDQSMRLDRAKISAGKKTSSVKMNGRSRGGRHRRHNGHTKQGANRRFSGIPPRQPLGLLRRALLSLLGRIVY